jgi:flagellar biosynthesis chaperone FliJ
MVLKAQDAKLADQASRLAIEIERRRLSVVEADCAVRVLDKLDERRRADHRRQQDRQDCKRLDEAAAARHGTAYLEN